MARLIVYGSLLAAAMFVGGTLANGAREAWAVAVFTTHRGRFCQIRVALENYHETHGAYPPVVVRDAAGRPMHSWRTLLLPYLEQREIYDRYRLDEPWDGPHNRRLAARAPFPFSFSDGRSDANGLTGVVAVLGRPPACPVDPAFAEWTTPDAVVVGLIEANGLGVPWAKPEDVTADRLAALAADGRFGTLSHSGVAVAAHGLGRTAVCGGFGLPLDAPPATLLDGSAFCGDNTGRPASAVPR